MIPIQVTCPSCARQLMTEPEGNKHYIPLHRVTVVPNIGNICEESEMWIRVEKKGRRRGT